MHHNRHRATLAHREAARQARATTAFAEALRRQRVAPQPARRSPNFMERHLPAPIPANFPQGDLRGVWAPTSMEWACYDQAAGAAPVRLPRTPWYRRFIGGLSFRTPVSDIIPHKRNGAARRAIQSSAMKLKSILLRNLRCYPDEIRIQISNLTALIGKNDVGKSTVLEALEIFFNNAAVKIDPQDACMHSDSKEITIGCEFDDLPDALVLDETAATTLKDEYLMNERGCLEIHKVFDCGASKVKESVFALAHHPKDELLLLKNAELKKRFEALKLDKSEAGVSLSSNPSLRKAIWSHTSDLQLTVKLISLEKTEDAKEIWTKLKAELPLFALFQSDRSSRDEDSEVQDPMKIAIGEALKELDLQLSEIKDTD